MIEKAKPEANGILQTTKLQSQTISTLLEPDKRCYIPEFPTTPYGETLLALED
jgi:hypothetical protein